MNAKETAKLIDSVGGDSAFARLLGIDREEFAQQKVNNWKRRGLPPKVELEHYELLKKLRASPAALSKAVG
jgi:DNA-binding transcriptional regulator YdaS (Cro superfamily)